MGIETYPAGSVPSGSLSDIQQRLKTLEDLPTRGSLILNGEMEAWNVANTEPLDWGSFWSSGTYTLSKDSTIYARGGASAKVALNASAFIRRSCTEFRVAGGDMLVVRWKTRGSSTFCRNNAMIHTNEAGFPPTFFGGGSLAQAESTKTAPTTLNTWEDKTAVFTVPVNHTRAAIYIVDEALAGGAGDMWVDSVSVVAAGPPGVASDVPWIAPSMVNSWVNYAGAYELAGYKRVNGVVYLKGLVKDGTYGGATIFTLPAGYRPTKDKIFGCPASGGVLRVDVTSAGAVYANGTTAGAPTNAFVSLDGISFPADQ